MRYYFFQNYIVCCIDQFSKPRGTPQLKIGVRASGISGVLRDLGIARMSIFFLFKGKWTCLILYRSPKKFQGIQVCVLYCYVHRTKRVNIL